jgi:capsular exopolysaccharide synthesis family protein
MDSTPLADRQTSRVDDGRNVFDAPIRDALLRLGYLSEEQTARVVGHQNERGLDFDQAALELGFITTDDLDQAREQLITSMALQDTRRRDVSDELVVLSEPSGLRSEAIRLLRTQIIAQHIRSGRRGLAMVSAVEGAGCSYLSANLAASLSQVGIKTLLIDANMRTPSIAAYFGIDPNEPGLSSFLSLQVSRPERVVNANVLPSLSVMTAGPAVGRPQELLSGTRFRDGTNMLLREYDLVLFDTPPASANADALTVGAAAGYALIVARRDHSYFSDISTLANQLAAARCPVVGSVLNEF